MLLFFTATLLLPMSSLRAAPGSMDTFLSRFWVQPIAPQGKPQKSFSKLEASLDPSACGTCHQRQWEDWKTSLHAHAMGPGVMGQLVEVHPTDTSSLRDCTRCHAPLAEQEASLKKQLRGKKSGGTLHQQGLVCAACHVRENVRYGPPPMTPKSDGKFPHNGFVVAPAFEDGRFCAICHQFDQDGYALNGKPLENTYAEWQASRYAKQGMQCQSCHMPERRHLWRGIHDPEMTRKGVTVEAIPPVVTGGNISARLVLTNSGTGHYFPTYITPRVTVQIYQETAGGQLAEGTLREITVARHVAADLSAELADTRLAPGARAVLEYLVPRHPDALAIIVRVRVEPDHFYSGLYRSLLEAAPGSKGAGLLRAALKNSLESAYNIFERRHTLSEPPGR
ncbi:MAG: hypothetical protein FD134_1360 [Gallionellaceae bacterium]|nr:MAG: hypothetical protein FD134_1360 [Gallionellaceae bacterium]